LRCAHNGAAAGQFGADRPARRRVTARNTTPPTAPAPTSAIGNHGTLDAPDLGRTLGTRRSTAACRSTIRAPLGR
jgi:hypothetical protein